MVSTECAFCYDFGSHLRLLDAGSMERSDKQAPTMLTVATVGHDRCNKHLKGSDYPERSGFIF
jgi:hypothetical protein